LSGFSPRALTGAAAAALAAAVAALFAFAFVPDSYEIPVTYAAYGIAGLLVLAGVLRALASLLRRRAEAPAQTDVPDDEPLDLPDILSALRVEPPAALHPAPQRAQLPQPRSGHLPIAVRLGNAGPALPAGTARIERRPAPRPRRALPSGPVPR
jgi:hypothetical protein